MSAPKIELPRQSRLHNLQAIANAFLFGFPDVLNEEGRRRLVAHEELFRRNARGQTAALAFDIHKGIATEAGPLPEQLSELEWLTICREHAALYASFRRLGYLEPARGGEIRDLDVAVVRLELAAAQPDGFKPPADPEIPGTPEAGHGGFRP